MNGGIGPDQPYDQGGAEAQPPAGQPWQPPAGQPWQPPAGQPWQPPAGQPWQPPAGQGGYGAAQPAFGGVPSYGDPAYGSPAYGSPAYGSPAYGDPSYGDPGQPGPGYGVYLGSDGSSPPTHMAWGIAAAVGGVLFCLVGGLPTAIAATTYARRVKTRWAAGDHEGARQASKTARTWAIAATVLDVIGFVVFIALIATGPISTANGGA